MPGPVGPRNSLPTAPLAAEWKGCAHSLRKWEEVLDRHGKTVMMTYAIPCNNKHQKVDGKIVHTTIGTKEKWS
jgi:hypothetical protein